MRSCWEGAPSWSPPGEGLRVRRCLRDAGARVVRQADEVLHDQRTVAQHLVVTRSGAEAAVVARDVPVEVVAGLVLGGERVDPAIDVAEPLAAQGLLLQR